MSVGDAIVGRRGDQKLFAMRIVIMKRTSRFMVKEGETALQPARDFGMGGLPRSPFCERTNCWQVIAVAQFFENKIGQRRGRFADDEPWMLSLFEQHDRAAELARNHGRERAGKAGTDYRDVECADHNVPPASCWRASSFNWIHQPDA